MSNESANWHNQGDLGKIEKLQAENKRLRELLQAALPIGYLQAENERMAKQIDEKNKEIERLATGETLAHFANKRLENENVNLADSLSYNECILNGSWPQAVEILEKALKNAKALKKGD